MSDDPNRAGGCEWLGDGIRVQYALCWSCICGQCPGHADPSEQKCGCVCADGPELTPEPDEPEWESLNAAPCTVCGSTGACGTDSDGNDWAHIEPYEEDQ